MAASSAGRRCGRMHTIKNAVWVVACAWLMASCASPSDPTAAIQASDGGDQKTAIRITKKEVARYSGPDQCSRTTSTNCGTLALAYGSLAGYQILDGDSTAGEESFRKARAALSMTDPAIRASATAMVYRDVSEAFWRVGDRARASDVFKEGRAAGADEWLFMTPAARGDDAGQQRNQPAEPPGGGRDGGGIERQGPAAGGGVPSASAGAAAR